MPLSVFKCLSIILPQIPQVTNLTNLSDTIQTIWPENPKWGWRSEWRWRSEQGWIRSIQHCSCFWKGQIESLLWSFRSFQRYAFCFIFDIICWTTLQKKTSQLPKSVLFSSYHQNTITLTSPWLMLSGIHCCGYIQWVKKLSQCLAVLQRLN